ncbi:hypothetical protein HAZT_HAZT000265 [Hyalella azteca]|uniref:Uncharacterized protein n=1 Tax=Hyalella azteca TaxID=294128 RepID=A0A6A0GTQ8_HYAAZ|nr:hypothetical protein HAZT_HAZT000265 [Hyalella azteca]
MTASKRCRPRHANYAPVPLTAPPSIKKNQQRTIMILESKNIPYVAIDITDPSQEEAKEYMTTTAVPKPNAKVPVTPQIFNEADYCGVRCCLG